MAEQPPNFTQRNWLEIVTAHEPEFYKKPVAYEFSRGRKFLKDDNQWYSTLARVELLTNPGFESGSGDAFTGWELQIADGDAISEDTSIFHGGSRSVKPRYGSGMGVPTFIYQDVAVAAGTTINFEFYSRGDGTRAGRYMVDDLQNGTDIITWTSTGNTTTEFKKVSGSFVVPEGCTTIRFELGAPTAAGSAYYDDASMWV
jgi:hypothetical protein